MLLLAHLSISGVGVELTPLLHGGVVEQPAQWIVFRHAALEVLGPIRFLSIGLGAPKGVHQLLLSSTDPPISNITISIRVVDGSPHIELVKQGLLKRRTFRFIVFVGW